VLTPSSTLLPPEDHSSYPISILPVGIELAIGVFFRGNTRANAPQCSQSKFVNNIVDKNMSRTLAHGASVLPQ
jgi:hypothetical protein